MASFKYFQFLKLLESTTDFFAQKSYQKTILKVVTDTINWYLGLVQFRGVIYCAHNFKLVWLFVIIKF